MGQIFLVRHGQASFGAADYDQLSDLGQRQAGLLGSWLADSRYSITAIAAGTLKRHRQTAENCLAAMTAKGADVLSINHIDGRLNEYDFSEVMGRWKPELSTQDGVKQMMAAAANPIQAFTDAFFTAMARWTAGAHPQDYREPWSDFRRRCVDALLGLTHAFPKQTLVVFSSGGPITAIAQHALGLPDDQAVALARPLLNCGVTKLLFRPGEMGLSYLNSAAHLEPGGQAMLTYR